MVIVCDFCLRFLPKVGMCRWFYEYFLVCYAYLPYDLMASSGRNVMVEEVGV